jgi:hypothetical protein
MFYICRLYVKHGFPEQNKLNWTELNCPISSDMVASCIWLIIVIVKEQEISS